MLEEVNVPPLSLDAYAAVAGDEAIEEIRRLAAPLRDARILHVNATKFGGGVAGLGIDADTSGDVERVVDEDGVAEGQSGGMFGERDVLAHEEDCRGCGARRGRAGGMRYDSTHIVVGSAQEVELGHLRGLTRPSAERRGRHEGGAPTSRPATP